MAEWIARYWKQPEAAELLCSTAGGFVYRWLVNPAPPMKALHDQLCLNIVQSLARAAGTRLRGRTGSFERHTSLLRV
jgi:hypothetical protein